MAPLALDGPFVSCLMAGDAKSMSSLFVPIFNLAGFIGGMAERAFVIQAFLVMPVLEMQH